MIDYEKLKQRILTLLNEQLPSDLAYHGTHHTLDVLDVCNAYIERESITDKEALLLRTGVLFHDFGFTRSFDNHERNGANLAEEILPDFGFSEQDIKTVEGLIMATKIPQEPGSELEKIICDADLDYLGRDDYYPISNTLFKELQSLGKIKTEEQWKALQIGFLEAHHYHTDFAIENRQPEKEKRIAELKAKNGG
jgi:predicted metal-dependent HD superfamily phosphohydrolase